jgi:hypothetical protein
MIYSAGGNGVGLFWENVGCFRSHNFTVFIQEFSHDIICMISYGDKAAKAERGLTEFIIRAIAFGVTNS